MTLFNLYATVVGSLAFAFGLWLYPTFIKTDRPVACLAVFFIGGGLMCLALAAGGTF